MEKSLKNVIELIGQLNSVVFNVTLNTFFSISLIILFSLLLENGNVFKKKNEIKQLYESLIKNNDIQALKQLCEEIINKRNAPEIIPEFALLLLHYEKYSLLNYLLDKYRIDNYILPLLLYYQNHRGISTQELVLLNPGKNFKLDLNVQNEEGDTPLIIACRKNSIKTVKCLVNCGADLNKKNNKRETALTIAYEGNHESILKILNDMKDKNHS